MKRFIVPLLTAAIVVSMVLTGCVPGAAPPVTPPPVTPPPVTPPPVTPPPVTPPPVAPAGKFGLDDIPPIQNKTPLNIVIESGAFTDVQRPFIEEFTEATGIPVTIHPVGSTEIYSKQIPELKAGTGAYDIIMNETAWTWGTAQYAWKIKDLANQFDPGGWDACWSDIQFHHPAMLRVCSANGEIVALPYYIYDMALWIRQDIFDDPTEQANFKAKYGYDLAPPTTEQQVYDMGEFFTRKKGDLLKGKPLENDIYGLAMMAGAYQINDEVSSRLWGKGADYATVVKDAAGNPVEFVITKEDKAALKEVMTEYISELQWASPGCLTANFDFVCAQQAEGRAIIQPTQFMGLAGWTVNMSKDKGTYPELKLGWYPTIGGAPYTGAWSQAVALDSKNPEAAYWLARYLGSYEAQLGLVLVGWSVDRTDVLTDPLWDNPAVPEYAYPIKMVNQYCLELWDATKDTVGDHFYFNSVAGMLIYEMQMDVLAKAVSRELTIDQMIAELVAKTIDLQTKFGAGVPIREEL